MKRLALAILATGVISTGALAADIQPIIPMATPAPIFVPPPDPSNLYVSLFGGMLFVRNAVWYQPEPEAALDLRGYRVSGAVGFVLRPILALEGEVTWGRGYVTQACFGPIDDQSCFTGDDLDEIDGDFETTATLLTLMGNVRLGPTTGTFRPYVAFGGGAALLKLVSDFGADGVGPGGGDNKDWTWAAQAMAGVDIALGENFTIGARYRFQRIGPTNFLDLADDPFTVGPFNVHSIEGGITLYFR